MPGVRCSCTCLLDLWHSSSWHHRYGSALLTGSFTLIKLMPYKWFSLIYGIFGTLQIDAVYMGQSYGISGAHQIDAVDMVQPYVQDLWYSSNWRPINGSALFAGSLALIKLMSYIWFSLTYGIFRSHQI